jgi:hypothetical protein
MMRPVFVFFRVTRQPRLLFLWANANAGDAFYRERTFRHQDLRVSGNFCVTVTIRRPSDIEPTWLQRLPVAQARHKGSICHNTSSMCCEQVPPRASIAVSPAERTEAWRQSVRGLPHTPPLSDEAISRESIYGDSR